LRHLDCGVPAGVVDQDDLVDDVVRDLVLNLLEGRRGVVGGQHDNGFLVSKHLSSSGDFGV
jgi:hypothetical protein